jgi:benzylsuccinate CoA-transferase BbsF subunit
MSATPVRLRPAPLLGAGGEWASRRPDERPPGDAAGPPGGSGPLAGVRVLDFTWAIAGPYATLLLALLGAEVVKVESARHLDSARRGFSGIDYGSPDGAPEFNTINLNKRSLGLDLSEPAGLDLIARLLPRCDVVVDNFRPGVMKRLGLDAVTLLAHHPSLVVASSSGNGSTGPHALYAGLASIFAATGGLSEQTGYPDAPPTLIGESPDFRSGNLLAVAILAALFRRQRTGHGQWIDLASQEVMAALAPDALLAHVLGAPPAGRSGNRDPLMAPHGVYPCQGTDEWVSVAVATDEEWAALCALIGLDDRAARYPDAAARKAAEDDLDRAVTDWTARRSAREAFLALQGAGVAAAPSMTNADLVADPNLLARGALVEVEHPRVGCQLLPAAPWRLSMAGAAVWRHGPLLGQDNEYVLGDLLGLSAPERAGYRAVLEGS